MADAQVWDDSFWVRKITQFFTGFDLNHNRLADEGDVEILAKGFSSFGPDKVDEVTDTGNEVSCLAVLVPQTRAGLAVLEPSVILTDGPLRNGGGANQAFFLLSPWRKFAPKP